MNIGETRRMLDSLKGGDARVIDDLLPLVYGELHDIAGRYLRQERRDHTLQATALVNEAYLRMVDQEDVEWQDRAHFLAVASVAIRRILVDHARKHRALKRGGERGRARAPARGYRRAFRPGRAASVSGRGSGRARGLR